NSVRLFDVTSGKETKAVTNLHTAPVSAVLFTGDGQRIVSGGADKTVQVWGVADGVAKLKLTHDDAVTSLALSNDGNRVAAGAAKGVKVWTLADGKPSAAIAAAVRSLSFNPDGTRLAAGDGNYVNVYGADGKLLEFFTHDAPVAAVAYH